MALSRKKEGNLMKVTSKQICDRLAEAKGLTKKEAKEFYEFIFKEFEKELKNGNDITIGSLGTLAVIKKNDYRVTSPISDKTYKTHYKAKYRAAKKIADIMKDKCELAE
jgi:nucleoid DNA-binding protein